MDSWWSRVVSWFSDIPHDVPATVIRKPDHAVVIVHDPIVSYGDSAIPRTTMVIPPPAPPPPKLLVPINRRKPVVKKKMARKKRKV
jgi:hypothetical protein